MYVRDDLKVMVLVRVVLWNI